MKDLQEIGSKHPAVVYAWISDWLASGKKIEPTSETIHWLGVAEMAAGYASGIYGKRSVLENMLWGSISITVYEEIAKCPYGPFEPLSDAMVVRFNLIAEFGNYPGDPIFDSVIIVQWFLRELPMTLDEAKHHAKNRPADRSDYEFKMLIFRLKLLRDLAQTNKLVSTSEVQKWLELCPADK
jgi:hypothetical protein